MRASKMALTKKERIVDEWFEMPMAFVTLLLVVTLVIPLVFNVGTTWTLILASFNLLIWCTFYIELFVKVYVAKSKLAALRRNWFLCVIAVAPLFLSFRFVRLGRLVSFLRFLGLQKYIEKLNHTVRELIYNVEYILITLVGFVVAAALLMWQVELRYEGSITSLADALWWAVITITTIGYGDIIPSSEEGKILGAVVGMLGAILFMVFVARITTLFVHDKHFDKLERLIKKQQKS